MHLISPTWLLTANSYERSQGVFSFSLDGVLWELWFSHDCISKINVAVVTVVFETVHLKDCCVKILASVILAFWSQT